MIKLGVNVDHVATLRQARRVRYPDPVEASLAAERAGANAITVHLREDRRHIQDTDLFGIHQAIKIRLNQEMAPIPEMLEVAMEVRPDEVCLVPERREELTTEGGLDAAGLKDRLQPILERLSLARIGVSLFIDPEPEQIEAAAMLGADFVEIHTGMYANLADADLAGAREDGNRNRRKSLRPAGRKGSPEKAIPPEFSEATRAELQKIRAAVKLARTLKLKPNAGHGLNYDNVVPVAAIPGIAWLHIGHAIVARSTIAGMERAVREMLRLINGKTA
ncbi:MAG TPA: pyridoxine 5'-phosphate synthase [Candidatus Binataceae bacterium]|nr:pyridoxine 5'-phosphate synthase [Candidatus Binataceae bacterium]